MRIFVNKVLLFILPFALFFTLPCLVLFISAEYFVDIESVIASSDKGKLVGYAYNQKSYQYIKWRELKNKQDIELIALGSSRVLQFRKEMFSCSFYNAGFTIRGLRDFEVLLTNTILQGEPPKYLIIGMDQWMFNESWDGLLKEPDSNKWENGYSIYPELGSLISVYKDLINNKYKFGNLLHKQENKYGLNAIVNNKGLRNDGSFYYGAEIEELKKGNFGFLSEEDNRIATGTERFKFADKINSESIPVLADLLAICKANKIHVIGFLPPFGDVIFRKMQTSGNYGYFEDLVKNVNPIFEEYGFEFYDFSSVSYFGSSDQEIIDNYHGGELSYARLLYSMLLKGSKLNDVCDIDSLQYQIQNPIDNYTVYEY